MSERLEKISFEKKARVSTEVTWTLTLNAESMRLLRECLGHAAFYSPEEDEIEFARDLEKRVAKITDRIENSDWIRG